MYLKLRFGAQWAQWIITNVWLVSGAGNHLKVPRIEYSTQRLCLKGIQNLRIGIVYASVMKFTLGGALSISYVLYASPESDIASIVYNTGRNQSQRMRKGSTVGPQQVTISSLTLHSMRFLAIPTEKCHSRSISTRFKSLWLKPGFYKAMILPWKKMEIVGMARQKTTTLCESGRQRTSWNTFSTVLPHLISPLLKIAGNRLSSISKNIHIGMITLQKS